MVINELRMNPNHKCFAHVLNDGGYETAYIGKWHLYANKLGDHGDPKIGRLLAAIDKAGIGTTQS